MPTEDASRNSQCKSTRHRDADRHRNFIDISILTGPHMAPIHKLVTTAMREIARDKTTGMKSNAVGMTEAKLTDALGHRRRTALHWNWLQADTGICALFTLSNDEIGHLKRRKDSRI